MQLAQHRELVPSRLNRSLLGIVFTDSVIAVVGLSLLASVLTHKLLPAKLAGRRQPVHSVPHPDQIIPRALEHPQRRSEGQPELG